MYNRKFLHTPFSRFPFPKILPVYVISLYACIMYVKREKELDSFKVPAVGVS